MIKLSWLIWRIVATVLILFVCHSFCNYNHHLNPNDHHYHDQSLTQNYYKHFTPLTNWTKCVNCWQHRLRICLTPKCKNTVVDEERPCDRRRCLRQRHMRFMDKSLRILNPKTISRRNLFDFPYSSQESDIWSKWSEWKQCSHQCKTQRYKVCRKPGRCLSKRKTETAYCYMSNTHCSAVVSQLLHGIRPENEIRREPKKKRRKVCGKPNKRLMMKIIGGQNAQMGKWPWHVAILDKTSDVLYCSGTLIAPRWVLTASHCVHDYGKVRVNEYDLSKRDGEREIAVVAGIRHFKFDDRTVDNDIGLLKLARRVNLPVACLPKRPPTPTQNCSIMGWGSSSSYSKLGNDILQEAKIPVVDYENCKKSYRKYYISRNMFCAGYPAGNKDTCNGDSGGGLMCLQREKMGNSSSYMQYSVQGITSFGEGCGRKNKYGIYTNVWNYITWIKMTMKAYATT